MAPFHRDAAHWVDAITDAAIARGLRPMYYTAYVSRQREVRFYELSGVVYYVSCDMGDPNMARLEEWLPPLVKDVVRDAWIVHDVCDEDEHDPDAIAAIINSAERMADEESSKWAEYAVLRAREWLRDVKPWP
jgi:hypothetical protein